MLPYEILIFIRAKSLLISGLLQNAYMSSNKSSGMILIDFSVFMFSDVGSILNMLNNTMGILNIILGILK